MKNITAVVAPSIIAARLWIQDNFQPHTEYIIVTQKRNVDGMWLNKVVIVNRDAFTEEQEKALVYAMLVMELNIRYFTD